MKTAISLDFMLRPEFVRRFMESRHPPRRTHCTHEPPCRLAVSPTSDAPVHGASIRLSARIGAVNRIESPSPPRRGRGIG